MKKFVLVGGAKEQINKIFEKAGVTKKEVAELLDISAGALHYKMNGDRSSFSVREAKARLQAWTERFTAGMARRKLKQETRRKSG